MNQILKVLLNKVLNLFGLEIALKSNLRALYQKHSEIFFTAKVFYEYSLKNRFDNLTDPELLQFLEIKYGGYNTDVSATINLNDVARIYGGKHSGGDRMNIFFNNYSKKYSEYLKPLRHSKLSINILEVGILEGTGLAVWDEYFVNKQIFGFDYDLGNFSRNKNKLIDLGAFQKNLPTIKFYDQFSNNTETLERCFGLNKIDIIIDDAYHSDEAIINTFNELMPYLNNRFIYFIEDNRTAWKKLRMKYPHFNFDYNDDLTVVTIKDDSII